MPVAAPTRRPAVGGYAQVALVGNPNCGKSTLFNRLTGLRQRTGNFPGVTVERKRGVALVGEREIALVDLPGTYSLHPDSLDERVVLDSLLGLHPGSRPPDAIVYVADAAKLDKHLLLLTQVMDLGRPVLLALNFADELAASGQHLDAERLAEGLGVPTVLVSGRTGAGFDALERELSALLREGELPGKRFFDLSAAERAAAEAVAGPHEFTSYARLLLVQHGVHPGSISPADPGLPTDLSPTRLQVRETMQRFDRFLPVLGAARRDPDAEPADGSLSDRIDAVTTHPVFGPLVFLGVLLLVFQAIFTWAQVPTELIEYLFATAGQAIRGALPDGRLADFLVDGILAGLGGVAVFVPQIAILFLLLTLLEEAGYMARAVFLFDRLMQRFGLNGRSLVALTSSGACAIPAVMSARTITNPRERLITILVAPLISCSARIPVYAILIGFAVPPVLVWGVFSAQALAFMAVYFASIAAALFAALAFKLILPEQERSYLMIELPPYRVPVWRNVAITVWVKTKAFLFGAGKIIVAISMVLWVLASFGPGDAVDEAAEAARREAVAKTLPADQTADVVANAKLEASYAGVIGQAIEPVIRPLGYDWRIGIALVTSFAAREVFVGTIATLYAIGSAEDEGLITERMSEARRPDGSAVYTPATAVSLIVFYLFAMQCMSTLAVVRRETGTWKWPLVQVAYMTGLAYLGAWGAYAILS